jgi:hypothetical protein
MSRRMQGLSLASKVPNLSGSYGYLVDRYDSDTADTVRN